MNRFVIDASVAIKWVVEESGTADALALRRHRLSAPDLMVAECANILWKKVRLKQLTQTEADLAARLLARADVELAPMRTLIDKALSHAMALDHPAYDAFYLQLALESGAKFVTADDGLVGKVRAQGKLKGLILSLAEAAKL